MAKFKPGDRIRILEDNGYGYKKGDTGTIVQEGSRTPWCQMDRESGDATDLSHVREEWKSGNYGMWEYDNVMELISGSGVALDLFKKPIIKLNCDN